MTDNLEITQLFIIKINSTDAHCHTQKVNYIVKIKILKNSAKSQTLLFGIGDRIHWHIHWISFLYIPISWDDIVEFLSIDPKDLSQGKLHSFKYSFIQHMTQVCWFFTLISSESLY